MATVIIRGSWGSLHVDRATGAILFYDGAVDLGHDETGYTDILYVMPETMTNGRDDCLDHHGETDILAIGFVDAAGTVVMPMLPAPDGLLCDPLLLTHYA